MSEFKKYGIEYGMIGNADRWTMTVMANSPEDAMARVKAAAAWGHCYTPHGIYAQIPAAAGPLVRFGVWLRNLFQ
jgi:hypothetical protein